MGPQILSIGLIFAWTLNLHAQDPVPKIVEAKQDGSSLLIDIEIHADKPVRLPEPSSILGILSYTAIFTFPSGAIVRCRIKPEFPPSGRIRMVLVDENTPYRFQLVFKKGETEISDRIGQEVSKSVRLEINIPEGSFTKGWSGRVLSEKFVFDFDLGGLVEVVF